LQKGIQNTFDDIDLHRICTYATQCELDISVLDEIDVAVCTYGSMVQYDIQKQYASVKFIKKVLDLSRMTILLVDSKQTQDVEAQKQRVKELTLLFPHIGNHIWKDIDFLTNMAAATLQKIFDISNDNELSAEIKMDRHLEQYKILEVNHVT